MHACCLRSSRRAGRSRPARRRCPPRRRPARPHAGSERPFAHGSGDLAADACRPDLDGGREQQQGVDEGPHLLPVARLQRDHELLPDPSGAHEPQQHRRAHRALEAVEGVGQQPARRGRHQRVGERRDLGGPCSSQREVGTGVGAVERGGEHLSRLRPEGDDQRQHGDERVEAQDAHQQQRPHELVDGSEGDEDGADGGAHRTPGRWHPTRPRDVAEDDAPHHPEEQGPRGPESGEGQRHQGRLPDQLQERAVQPRGQGARTEVAQECAGAAVDARRRSRVATGSRPRPAVRGGPPETSSRRLTTWPRVTPRLSAATDGRSRVAAGPSCSVSAHVAA